MKSREEVTASRPFQAKLFKANFSYSHTHDQSHFPRQHKVVRNCDNGQNKNPVRGIIDAGQKQPGQNDTSEVVNLLETL